MVITHQSHRCKAPFSGLLPWWLPTYLTPLKAFLSVSIIVSLAQSWPLLTPNSLPVLVVH